MTKAKKGVSLVINTKNEAHALAACIKSAKGLYSEIVVMDMHSTDNTRLVAKQLGARVYKTDKDYLYVEPARNSALQKATYEWVLLLDADEHVTSKLKRELSKIYKNDLADIVKVPKKNIVFGKWLKHTHYWPDYHYQFFKKQAVVWQDKIHTLPKIQGRVKTLPAREELAIQHFSHASISSWLAKASNYTKFNDYFETNQLDSLDHLEKYSRDEFKFRFLYARGYKDGFHGYVVSKLMEFYRFLEFAHYWERQQFRNMFDQRALMAWYKKAEERDETMQLFDRLMKLRLFRWLLEYYRFRGKI